MESKFHEENRNKSHEEYIHSKQCNSVQKNLLSPQAYALDK
jgi:hypothetical protein